MDALLCFGVSLGVYTALVSGFTCLAIWCLLRQYRKALFGSLDFQPSCRPDTVYIGPGGASVAKGSRRKATTPEGCSSRAGSRMRDWGPDRSQCTSVEVPEEPRLPRARGARQQPRRDAVQSGLKIASLGS